MAAGMSVSQPFPNEEQQAPNLLKSLSSKLRSMGSMRRFTGDQSLQLSTQMSNLGPARQEGESAGATAMHAMLFMSPDNVTALVLCAMCYGAMELCATPRWPL